jgi:hypothetical protein
MKVIVDAGHYDTILFIAEQQQIEYICCGKNNQA